MNDIVLRILQEAKRKGMDQKELALQIGVRPQAITEWKKGTTSSYTKRLSEIAAALDTSVEYLLTGEKEKPATVSGSRPDFLIKFQSLTPEDQKEVMVLVEYKLGKKGG